MHKSNVIILMIIVILINAGISLVLINRFSGGNDNSVNAMPGRANRLAQETDITRVVESVEPAVVNIIVTQTQIVRSGFPFGGFFFDFFDIPTRRQVQGFGSGVIYDAKNGFVITNAHVVKGAEEIKVVLPDRRELDARIVKIDDVHDIAQLKVTASNLPEAPLGDSTALLTGEWVIAFGNPYAYMMNDYKPSVSVGVISALNRNFSMREDNRSYRNMIQTDAAINPGNSGGPLVDINGKVIGINTFIFSENGGNVGIGFALPINTVKEFLGI
ncbi:MAG: protease DegQ [Candidatus Cloacimonetes bacterium HGW-Cloacimonetes-2]|jgi:serine protease Do|nr:MAG: protease DegQ [Candidatus Cloacimonetes bacterium HGW-Cloacimonetes-2]